MEFQEVNSALKELYIDKIKGTLDSSTFEERKRYFRNLLIDKIKVCEKNGDTQESVIKYNFKCV